MILFIPNHAVAAHVATKNPIYEMPSGGIYSNFTHESGMYVFKPSNTMNIKAELGADRTHVMPQPL